MLTTPVAFIIFNRPDLTQIVFDAIAAAKPRTLLVVADGPRSPEESKKCMECRAVIDQVDWECEVLTNYSDVNLGCKYRVSSGLDWVFEQVEEAIILEDDCLPTSSFFSFCEALLERYRDDERIMHIGGGNFQKGMRRTPYSYYFSKYAHVWGWASWRRAWQHYDVEMRTWPQCKGQLNRAHDKEEERRYWSAIFDRVHAGEVDTWDYQWNYTCWMRNGLSVVPEYNLISNIGFRSDATHTTSDSAFASLTTSDMSEIIHSQEVVRNEQADAFTFATMFGGESRADKLPQNLKGYAYSILHRAKNLLKTTN